MFLYKITFNVSCMPKIKRMSLIRIGFLILFLGVFITSCNNDDDNNSVTPPRDREEVQIEDDVSIIEYLKTHYYNSSIFEDVNSDASLADLEIKKLENDEAEVPDGHTLLFEAIEAPKTTNFAGVDYKYYILKIKQGKGSDSPNFTDNIRVQYQGNLLNESVFDNTFLSTPVDIDLLSLLEGWWRLVLPEFNTAMGVELLDGGEINYQSPGMGMMFLPSGVGYFNQIIDGIPQYSPLIFKFELLQNFEIDHDNDGIPSYMEAVDAQGELVAVSKIEKLATYDTDENGISNYLDADDDNDGVLTKDEIVTTFIEKDTREEVLAVQLETNQVLTDKITEKRDLTTGEINKYVGKVITFTDTDGDSIPDYIDAE